MLAMEPALPANVTLKELPALSEAFSAAKELLALSKPFQPSATASVVVFRSRAEGKRNRNHRLKPAVHFTSPAGPHVKHLACTSSYSDALVEDVAYPLFHSEFDMMAWAAIRAESY